MQTKSFLPPQSPCEYIMYATNVTYMPSLLLAIQSRPSRHLVSMYKQVLRMQARVKIQWTGIETIFVEVLWHSLLCLLCLLCLHRLHGLFGGCICRLGRLLLRHSREHWWTGKVPGMQLSLKTSFLEEDVDTSHELQCAQHMQCHQAR